MKCLLLIFALVLIFYSACERRTVVKIEGTESPIFILSGNGTLGEVVITKPANEQHGSPLEPDNALWQIKEVNMKGKSVDVIKRITYGVVPEGYVQIIPTNGTSPPKLEANKKYGYLFVTADAPHGHGYFEMKNGIWKNVEQANTQNY
jgi:hypothetical protein